MFKLVTESVSYPSSQIVTNGHPLGTLIYVKNVRSQFTVHDT